MGIPAEKRRYSIEEYLEWERKAESRHEFDNGEILAMSGGSPAQSFIIMNIGREVGNAIKGMPCRIAESNLRIGIQKQTKYLYPDASIICGPLQFDPIDKLKHTDIKPRVNIEVLSHSTEAYDRGDKFKSYRQIASLEEYILLSQYQPQFESMLLQPDGTWSFLACNGLDSVAKIRCLGIDILMKELYAGVDFSVPFDESQASDAST